MPRQLADVIDGVNNAELMSKVPRERYLSGDTIKRAAHRWAVAQGYGAGIASGYSFNNSTRLICFSRETIEMQSPSLRELTNHHENLVTASHRWAVSQGFFTGWLNGEKSGDNMGVACLKDLKADGSSVFQYIAAADSDIEASPDPLRRDKILRFAIDRDYVAGVWNGEQSDGRKGITCIPRII